MNVGAPVTATGNHGAVNYALADADSGDNEKFKVDPKTGQITTLWDLNREATAEATADTAGNCDGTDNECVVTIRVSDASGSVTATAADTANNVFMDATVTIDLKNVDEMPTFPTTTLTAIDVPENTANGILSGAAADGYTTTDAADVTYTASDPESRSLTYDLMGPDGSKFELSNTQVLSFRAAPDYEEPTDANMDNVYMVTVRASDGTMHADRMVRVTVMDADDGPEITEINSPIRYVENGEDSVVTFMATDQDGDAVTWSVGDGGTGTVDFKIDEDGVLEFLSSPDYDVPTGGNDNDSNTYVVTVTASSTGTSATAQTDTFNLTVMVTNVAEKGKVTWIIDPDGGGPILANDPTATPPQMPIMQFQVNAVLTATASDGDITSATQTFTADVTDEVTGVAWRWYRVGSSTSIAETNSYTVTSADVGSRLRVVVTYRVEGNINQESASLTSDYSVLAVRPGDNELEFVPTSVSREVSEGDKDMDVGAPVTATGNHGAVNYTLAGTDSDQFEIDRKTGQITTMVDLDYEADTTNTTNQCDTANDCQVTVTATDASGDATTTPATVDIDIKDMDEEPTFTERAAGVTTGTASPTAITSPENRAALYDTGTPADAANVTYEAMDPEGLNVNLTLMGPDGDKFSLSTAGVLSFMTAPDYEMPTDANRDNVYEVTVRASDGTLHEDRMVKVTVMDVNEAPVIVEGGLTMSSGMSRVSVEENTTAVGTYMVAGPDASSARWTLEGADMGDFRIDGSGMSAMLRFSASPDYEMPADANEDNVYMVTVKATDSEGNMATMRVTVTVTDVADEQQTLVQRYAGTDGVLQLEEVYAAIDDYFDNDALTLEQLYELVDLYFES